MNKARRRSLDHISSKLQSLKTEIGRVMDDERSAYLNMPVHIRDGKKGEDMENNIENLEWALLDLNSVIDSVNKSQR